MNKVLLTGSSGFLGTYFLNAIARKGWYITTLGRTDPTDVKCDLSTKIPEIHQKYDLVIHNAGLAHKLPKSDFEANAFFNVNVKGTVNLLSGLEQQPPDHFVFISSVSVYGLDKGDFISESSPLLARDPYGKSKIEAEKAIQLWCKKIGCDFTIFRLPLVVGKNAPGNLNDMIAAIKNDRYFSIRNAVSRRSMVYAQDVAQMIASDRLKVGIFNLTDGMNPSFRELENYLSFKLNKKIRSIPYVFAKGAALIGDLVGTRFPVNSYKLAKLRSSLTFSDEKAREVLGWEPNPILSDIHEIT